MKYFSELSFTSDAHRASAAHVTNDLRRAMRKEPLPSWARALFKICAFCITGGTLAHAGCAGYMVVSLTLGLTYSPWVMVGIPALANISILSIIKKQLPLAFKKDDWITVVPGSVIGAALAFTAHTGMELYQHQMAESILRGESATEQKITKQTAEAKHMDVESYIINKYRLDQFCGIGQRPVHPNKSLKNNVTQAHPS